MSNTDQNESPLPTGGNAKRKSVDLLPKYFRTQANEKILGSTLDQMVQPGVAEKISGFYGSKTAKAFSPGDTYIEDVSDQRQNRQLEPATVVKDDLDNVLFYKDYSDFVNQISAFRGDTSNHSLLNAQEYYAWNPNVDWDKLTNFREYFWLPNGPQTVTVTGQQQSITSTYKVTVEEQDDNFVYKFSNRLTANPVLTLYRGQTYRFEIDTPGFPIAFTVDSSFTIPDPDGGSENVSSVYTQGQTFFDADGNEIEAQYIEDGVIEFTVPLQSPDNLFYLSETDINTSGFIRVFNIEENTAINVEEEIIGKVTYTSANGVTLSNGMKVEFAGNVTPEMYGEGEWYVEGVGDSIRLVNEENLVIPAAYASDVLVPWGSGLWDRLPFGNASSFAEEKDYIVINRASADRNAWSRYNRWFHADVITASAEYNGVEENLDQSARATRPIIEFEAGLKLFNYGTSAKLDVDLIDTFTNDVFSIIEGSLGYNVDGVQLVEGQRILFTADPDPFVSGKIYRVTFITNGNNRQISLIEEPDTDPVENEVVLVTGGNENRGKLFWYDGTAWKETQEKTDTNQSPRFELYDSVGNSFADDTVYNQSTFTGNTVFGYQVGEGANDPELGFPLSYRTIQNVGDIQFEFPLVNGSFTYQEGEELFTKNTDIGYLRKYIDIDTFTVQNGWTKARKLSSQSVVRLYEVETETSEFVIDVYDRSSSVTDLKVKVYLDQVLQKEGRDYIIDRSNTNASVVFNSPVPADSVVILKVKSNAAKNENGYYEIAHNLERNPLNNKLGGFTLGEVNDHVQSIAENVNGFEGTFPGTSNLRDLGTLDGYGERFVQHSGPVNLALYHITNREANVVKALRYSKTEYAKFKRLLLQTAESLGFDGTPKQQLDLALSRINENKSSSMPFYFTDMLCTSATRRLEYVVPAANNRFYALTEPFTLDELSPRSVLVYLNSQQLIHGRDYTFNSEGFVNVSAEIEKGDLIEIFECDSTDGSYVPATPTKLGLFPATIPSIYVDNTYREPQKVIRGHDGSITIAFDDYRDEILLEYELRVYNNLKQEYNRDLFDIDSFVPGDFRETGYSIDAINRVMITDFVEWSAIAGDPDYTTNSFYVNGDGFTYNYTGTASPSGKALNGYWRSVYKQAYDTDHPNMHPWEMVGFTSQPTWWEEVYGPAPYTRDNLVLWQDMAEGVVREPGKPVQRYPEYARPTLLSHIPVDSSGNLLSPVDSNYVRNFVDRLARASFKFGDHTPAETAWRRSSEYPFSLITAKVLNQPNATFATGFDRSRVQRNQVGQIIYTETGKAIRLQDLVFPNAREDNTRVMTSGLVNYVFDYLSSNVQTSYNEYKEELTNIQNQIRIKVGGFTEKEKFNLILDSRTPLNEGNVFLPLENYQVFLNTSSPIDVISYSGVIIERTTAGYVIKGYDRETPVFKYKRAVQASTDPVINIGGVSEQFLNWDEGKQYIKGQNVRYNNLFYRVTESHVSGSTFDSSKFTQINSLPQVGGRDAVLRRNFEDRFLELSYGTLLPTVQEVVDFLLGYEAWLEDQGFEFNYFNPESSQVENWTFSVKEFLFWTTQNWATGSVITLSPGAEQVRFQREFVVVDDIFNNFYNYSLLAANGNKLDRRFSSIARSNQNVFGLRSVNTADGIFHIKLPLVQKEHVILIDNTSVFGDVLYDPEAGYRQQRIRVAGYRSDGWNGGLDIPGFIYDSAEVKDWEPWTDYAIGELVKYKEFFYVALFDVPGNNVFIASNWERLDSRPEAKLIPNFDYRINQFADFYDLDTDNFDVEQQKHAQHLIGYQKRQYLQNIINDDVSQYKFYQGFIQDKGTVNSLTKLFDALGSANKDSLEFYEEWAIRLGRYGDTENSEVVEFLLDEAEFRLSPQPVELVSRLPENATDLVYRLRPFEIYSAPKGYNNKPFPVTTEDPFELRSPGYVREDDISFRVSNSDNILAGDITSIGFGDYIWVVGLNEDWDVLQHVRSDLRVVSIEGTDDIVDVRADTSTPAAILTFERNSGDLKEGQYIGVQGTGTTNDSFYRIDSVNARSVVVVVPPELEVEDQEDINAYVSVLRSVRAKDIVEANEIVQQSLTPGQRLWIDNDSYNSWKVIENREIYSNNDLIENPDNNDDAEYARAFSATSDNTRLVVSDYNNGEGVVYTYTRASEANSLILEGELRSSRELDNSIDPGQEFGRAVAISPDGNWLAVGSPSASNLASPLVGDFDAEEDYAAGDVVKFSAQYWSADRAITGRVLNTEFDTFDSYAFITPGDDSTPSKLLLQGAPYIPETVVEHILVRAPADQYQGVIEREQAINPNSGLVETVKVDKLYLNWNNYTNLTRYETGTGVVAQYTDYEPFANVATDITGTIDSDFITGEHEIVRKIENILYIQGGQNVPIEGDIVTTTTAQGVVYKRYSQNFNYTLYIVDVEGVFEQEDTLFFNGEEVGDYIQPAFSADPNLGGFWYIETPAYTNAEENTQPFDFGVPGTGLVYQDLVQFRRVNDDFDNALLPTRAENEFVNILDTVAEYGTNRDRSYLINLSYRGDVQDILSDNPESRWLLRLPVEDGIDTKFGDTFRLWVNDTENSDDITEYGFTYEYLNEEEHTIVDRWDGYIDFEFTATQASDLDGDGDTGDFFEPDGSLHRDANDDVIPGETVIVFDNISGATGEVVFYQKRNINRGRVYLKNVTGTFNVNNLLRINTTEGGSPNQRTIGKIDKVSLASTTLGQLAVIDKGTDFPVIPETYSQPFDDFALRNGEYWFYNTETELGVGQEASYPSSSSRDWTQVFNVQVTPGKDRNGFTNQGVYNIYRRFGQSWERTSTYILPETGEDSNVGKDLAFAQQGNLYRLFVSTNDRVYVIKNGVDQEGNEYSWAIDLDPSYRGNWSTIEEFVDFREGDIVEYNNNLYRALTTVTDRTDPATSLRWEEIENDVNIEGFVPHSITEQIYDDSTFTDPNELEFADEVAVSANGQILAITVLTDPVNDSSTDNRVLIYRIKNNQYKLDQIIDAELPNTDFATSIDLSPNGEFLVIGEPESDFYDFDQGRVHVYRQVAGKYVLVQDLISPRDDVVEKFGFKVSATDSVISVASFNGDIVLPTTFDGDSVETTFDNGFTSFANQQADTGSVTVYENIEGTFVYADALEYSDAKNAEFGETLLAVRNHVYAGLPRAATPDSTGYVADYRRAQGQTAWQTLRSPLPIVDLNKIKEVYLFDTRTNQLVTYLDYIDVRQGKIAGPAAEEIDFKMFADPARYNATDDSRFFDDVNNWEDEYVGRVWWDMSTARFANPYQGDAIYQSANWNRLLPGASVDVYEWVESTVLPSEWDALADTNEGIARGISGQSKYGDDVYSQKLRYDPVSRTFSNVYYFWVANKFTLPNIERRRTSVGNIARLIQDPNSEGYQFVSFETDNRFVIYNADNLISGKDIALAVSYFTLDNQEQNTHNEYQLLSEGLETSVPKPDIERKWVDSLVGYDERGRQVPDPDLSPRQKYGTLFRPRQSWFVNREEALKQVVERANISLLSQPVVDSRDLTLMLAEDPLPTTGSRLYDYVVDSIEELRFIGTSKAARAAIEAEVVDGAVTNIVITDSGRRYNDLDFDPETDTVRQGPSIDVIGAGEGLEVDLIINNLGQVTGADIVDPGQGYTEDIRIDVRPVSALVRSDSSINGRWAIYAWNELNKEWQRTVTQDFDVKKYWDYADWYAEGYNQFTLVNFNIEGTYQLAALDDEIGDVIKVASIGQGGWLLLRKINDVDTDDFTVNYETIGRQNGTIQIKDILFDNTKNFVGYDVFGYDGKFFDTEPSRETRLIMQALKEDLLVDDLAVDYNALFFASIRYVFSEQLNVDWAFKTSFVKAKHNVGELIQKVTFQNNNLSSYNDYVEEAKPYKTNIREYVSAVERLEETNSVITDFDLPPKYSEAEGKIVPRAPKIVDDELVDADALFETFPDKNWKDNFGYKITEMQIYDPGSRYDRAPKVTITGGGGTGATAQAFIGQGKVTKVRITNTGSGYTSQPTVTIASPGDEEGVQAKATPILGDSVVRSMRVEIKFDRVSGQAAILSLEETQTFTGTGANTKFTLNWPMDMRSNRIAITIDGEEALRSEYSYTNIVDNSLSYERRLGQIEFATPPAVGAVISVTYNKSPALLNAAERIEYLYAPTTGMISNEISQLMSGVDYGGVEVRSFDFDTDAGWNTDEWATSTWDTYDTTYEDLVFRPDGSTTLLELDAPLEDGVEYNVYKNGVRIDDPQYDITSEVENKNAMIPTLIGDGSTSVVDLDEWSIPTEDGDVIIIRKTTSDGSFAPDPDSFDTQLDGGNLNYGNATGLNAEDIIVDGDLFVTPVTSGGPEELVPGQVLDTVDIKTFERIGDGQGEIFNQNYITNGVKETYSLGIKPNSLDAVIVKVNDNILSEDKYTIDYADNTVTFDPVLAANQKLTILTVGFNGNNVLDIGTYVSDGTQKTVVTNVSWDPDIETLILVNGVVVTTPDVIVKEENNSVAFEFAAIPAAGEVVDYALFAEQTDTRTYSRVLRDTIEPDGTSSSFTLSQAPGVQEPIEFYTFVEVGGFIASPGYKKEFLVEDLGAVEYQFDTFQIPEFTIDPAEVRVFVGTRELVRGVDFVVTISNSSIRVDPSAVSVGDILEAYYTKEAEYTITDNTIEFIIPISVGNTINVYQFTNHDVLDIDRITYNVVNRSNLIPGTQEFSTYHNLRGGKIFLRDPAAGVQYVWVVVNGKLMSPSVDYTLALDGKVVYLTEEPEVGDKIDIIHFAAPVRTPRLAWSQFKDILNRTHYKRLDNGAGQRLAAPLYEYDLRIEVEDATELPEPDKTTNKPGIIFINGERIEYFIKDGNLLRQLRRGTLGTGVKDVYPVGTVVEDRSSEKNIPYKDVTESQVIENDGSSSVYDTNFNLRDFELRFGQSYRDFFEVFVGGKRLRKNAIQAYQFDMVDENGDIVHAIAPDSPAGDVEVAKEFDIIVDETTGNVSLELAEVPEPDDKIVMVRKTGRLWSEQGTALKDADNAIANFLRSGISKLPE